MWGVQMHDQKHDLVRLANSTMPYGAHKGKRLIDLPEHYIVWYSTKGFPKGELGRLLGLLHTIQVNGLEYLVRPLKN